MTPDTKTLAAYLLNWEEPPIPGVLFQAADRLISQENRIAELEAKLAKKPQIDWREANVDWSKDSRTIAEELGCSFAAVVAARSNHAPMCQCERKMGSWACLRKHKHDGDYWGEKPSPWKQREGKTK